MTSEHLEERVAAPITPEQIAIVKATIPAIQKHGVEVTTQMYKTMLHDNPHLAHLFNQTNQRTGAQPRALAAAVQANAENIDNLGALGEVVEIIAHKHVSLHIKPEWYAIVGEHLIRAMVTVLGDAATPEVQSAWAAAYGALAQVFIDRETEIANAEGRWIGWRRFQVSRRIAESDRITSFYLVPEDGKPLYVFKPGQYISLQIDSPEDGLLQSRQYSLSDCPGKNYYRISVKKEDGKASGTAGVVSNLLHDKYAEGQTVELSCPTGPFFLQPSRDDNTTPVVLLSAGVGITPTMSMLNQLVNDEQSQRPIAFIHGAHSPEAQAFGPHVRELVGKSDRLRSSLFLTNGSSEGSIQGHVSLDKLDKDADLFLTNLETDYFVCGPESFMAETEASLIRAGVAKTRIHSEFFGTGGY